MGKVKNKANQQMQQQQGGQPSEETMNSIEHNKKEESNKNTQNENKGKNTNPKGVIVLGVFIHCEGCADKIVKSLRGFDGVELVQLDSKTHKVTVKGLKADPVKVLDRVRKKTGKHVELISPKLPINNEEVKKEEKKQEPKLVEVILKLHLHCEGCAKDMKHIIHKMEGVRTVEPDMKNSIVKVMGTFEPKKIVGFIEKEAGKHAEIVKQENKGGKNNQSGENNNNNNLKGEKNDSINPNFYQDFVYAPQLFSDENPNSCSIM